jgi:hypothetical protein
MLPMIDDNRIDDDMRSTTPLIKNQLRLLTHHSTKISLPYNITVVAIMARNHDGVSSLKLTPAN